MLNPSYYILLTFFLVIIRSGAFILILAWSLTHWSHCVTLFCWFFCLLYLLWLSSCFEIGLFNLPIKILKLILVFFFILYVFFINLSYIKLLYIHVWISNKSFIHWRWDNKTKKYVKVQDDKKRIKTESGVYISATYKTNRYDTQQYVHFY